jgi:hypothetical protein
MKELEEMQQLIAEECDAIKALLLDKNRKYGNSAMEPRRIFSKQSATEQIKVRIDDKISRISNMGFSDNNSKESEDSVKDLIGYLILLRIVDKIHEENGNMQNS